MSPKNVKLLSQNEYINGIAGLEAIENSFKAIKLQEYVNINKIGSISSRQARIKDCKFALSLNPKFHTSNSIISPDKNTPPHPEDNATARTALKIQMVEIVKEVL